MSTVLAHNADVTRLRPSYVVIQTGASEHLALQLAKRERQGTKGRHVEVQVTRWNHLGEKFKAPQWIAVERVLRDATVAELAERAVPR